MMKINFIIFYLLLFCCLPLYSQSKMDCNTIFVCIEKDDYDALFKNSYIRDTLFFVKKAPLKQQQTNIPGNILWANLPR